MEYESIRLELSNRFRNIKPLSAQGMAILALLLVVCGISASTNTSADMADMLAFDEN